MQMKDEIVFILALAHTMLCAAIRNNRAFPSINKQTRELRKLGLLIMMLSIFKKHYLFRTFEFHSRRFQLSHICCIPHVLILFIRQIKFKNPYIRINIRIHSNIIHSGRNDPQRAWPFRAIGWQYISIKISVRPRCACVRQCFSAIESAFCLPFWTVVGLDRLVACRLASFILAAFLV